MSTHQRKDEHFLLCLGDDVECDASPGLSRYQLEYDALPELDMTDVDPSVELFGKRLEAPLIIGAMTGGTALTGVVNFRLAEAAERLGLGMALGSQRAMIEEKAATPSFDVRAKAPRLRLLIGNLGAVQLNLGVTPQQITDAMEAVKADAVALHLNPLQEALQPEGDTTFRGLHDRIALLLPNLPLPCILKEVGAGISRKTIKKIEPLPVAGVDVGGVGGTCWAKVESGRGRRPVSRALANFGVPTAESIRICRQELGPDRIVIASGGVRTAMDVALCLALGADVVAMARPLLVAANHSSEQVIAVLSHIMAELQVLMFCTSSRTPADLRRALLAPPPASNQTSRKS